MSSSRAKGLNFSLAWSGEKVEAIFKTYELFIYRDTL